MVISSPLPLTLLLLPLIYAVDLPPSLPSTNDGTIPAFDNMKCEKDSSTTCLLPHQTSNDLVHYKNMDPYVPRDVQTMLRFYNPKIVLVEIWAKGSSAMLKDNKDSVIFGCKKTGSDGGVKPETERSKTTVTPLESTISVEQIYCKFTMTSQEEIFPWPSPSTFGDQVKLIALETYIATRKDLTSVVPTGCFVDSIQNGASLAREGYQVTDIPVDNLFERKITCPEGSKLVYESNNEPREATSITCTATSPFIYKIEIGNESNDKNGSFKAGCQRRVCEMCASYSFQCQSEGCTLPKSNVVDNCPVYQCPSPVISINDPSVLANGAIKCTKTESQIDYAWTIDGIRVDKASCPSKILCHIASKPTCDGDAKCTMLSELSKTVVDCLDNKEMWITQAGNNTNVRNLVCDHSSGNFQYTLNGIEVDLPKDALIQCKDAPPVTPDPAPMTGQMGIYVGAALAGVAAIAMILVIVLCCARNRRRKTKASQLTTGTRTKNETTKTNRSTEMSKPRTPIVPAQSVPIPPPTPIVRPTPIPTSPWDPDMTEMTPNAPTPLEQRTQSVQQQPPTGGTKSDSRSAPIIPLPRLLDESAAPDMDQSKSGVESTKRRGGKESEAEQKKNGGGESDYPTKKSTQHRTRRVFPTQNEESTKRTQNESFTKRTQNTQRTADDGGGGVHRIPTRMPPKKAEYIAMPDVDKDSFEDDEKSKSPAVNQKPFATPSREGSSDSKQSPYLQLDGFMDVTSKRGDKKTAETNDANLITQKTEEDKSKKK